MNLEPEKPKILLIGSDGYIGQQLAPLLSKRAVLTTWSPTEAKEARLNFEHSIPDDYLRQFDRVVCCLGRTHVKQAGDKPTIDTIEDKLPLNLNDNLFVPLRLAMQCHDMNIHFTYLGTGCIFSTEFPLAVKPYQITDAPDFQGSAYSAVKSVTDQLMAQLQSNVLNVRIRMPISDIHNPRDFVHKIAHYEKVINVVNSMSVLPNLLPILVHMVVRGKTGTVHLVNPGPMSHTEVLNLYRRHVDPKFKFQTFSVAEQNRKLKAPRSNNILDTKELERYCHLHELPLESTETALVELFIVDK